MTTHKQEIKQLKKPDSFQERILAGIHYVAEQPGRVALIVTPVVVVAVLAFSWKSFTEYQASNRRAELASVFRMRADEDEAVTKKMEAVEKELQELRKKTSGKDSAVDGSAAQKDKQEASAATAADLLRIGELETQLANAKPDHTKSSDAFKAYYEKNKNKPEGWTAGLAWASDALKDGKLQDARPVLEHIVKASSGNTSHRFHQVQARFSLAGVLQDLGEFDKALVEANALVPLVGEDAKPTALLLKGQIQFFMNDRENAKTTLKELVDKHASTREGQTARALLADIGAA